MRHSCKGYRCIRGRLFVKIPNEMAFFGRIAYTRVAANVRNIFKQNVMFASVLVAHSHAARIEGTFRVLLPRRTRTPFLVPLSLNYVCNSDLMLRIYLLKEPTFLFFYLLC